MEQAIKYNARVYIADYMIIDCITWSSGNTHIELQLTWNSEIFQIVQNTLLMVNLKLLQAH